MRHTQVCVCMRAHARECMHTHKILSLLSHNSSTAKRTQEKYCGGSTHTTLTDLFRLVQWYADGKAGHKEDAASVVVVLIKQPQDDAGNLEDVERGQHLYKMQPAITLDIFQKGVT